MPFVRYLIAPAAAVLIAGTATPAVAAPPIDHTSALESRRGREWAWASAQCARNTWTVRDEDAYTGPWNRRTAAPVLFVATKWDPATNYDDAVSARKRLPNSRLFTNDNWGHTSYRTSQCNADATEAYLVDLTLPPAGLVSVGSDQPFTGPVGSFGA